MRARRKLPEERDKERQRDANYRAKHPDKIAQTKRRHRAKHKDSIAVYRREYYEKNREQEARQSREWEAANPCRKKKYRQQDYERNKSRYFADAKRRECLKRQAMPAWASGLNYRSIYDDAARLTRETGIPHHVDHIVPLQGRNVCGLHLPWNLQVLTAAENLSKSNRL